MLIYFAFTIAWNVGDTPYSGFSWNLEFTKSLTDGLRLESPQYAAPNM